MRDTLGRRLLLLLIGAAADAVEDVARLEEAARHRARAIELRDGRPSARTRATTRRQPSAANVEAPTRGRPLRQLRGSSRRLSGSFLTAWLMTAAEPMLCARVCGFRSPLQPAGEQTLGCLPRAQRRFKPSNIRNVHHHSTNCLAQISASRGLPREEEALSEGSSSLCVWQEVIRGHARAPIELNGGRRVPGPMARIFQAFLAAEHRVGLGRPRDAAFAAAATPTSED